MSDFTNSGFLFKNDKKTEEKQPDYTGKLNIDGTEYKLAGWLRDTKDGRKFLSLKPSPATPPQQPAVARPPSPEVAEYGDDDVPF